MSFEQRCNESAHHAPYNGTRLGVAAPPHALDIARLSRRRIRLQSWPRMARRTAPYRQPGTLQDLFQDLVTHGSLKNDFILMCEAWRRATADDGPGFASAAELALALQPSKERHLENVTQGRSFMEAILAAWPAPRLSLHDPEQRHRLRDSTFTRRGSPRTPHRKHSSGPRARLVSNLTSAAIRLSIIGQNRRPARARSAFYR